VVVFEEKMKMVWSKDVWFMKCETLSLETC